MSDFASKLQAHKDMPEDAQKKAGKAIAGKMSQENEDFLKLLIGMLDRKEIVALDPQTFIKKDIYDSMPQEWKGKVDMALQNISHQLDRIEQFFRSKETPNESPHLETMLAHLLQMKKRIEEKFDVFKF